MVSGRVFIGFPEDVLLDRFGQIRTGQISYPEDVSEVL